MNISGLPARTARIVFGRPPHDTASRSIRAGGCSRSPRVWCPRIRCRAGEEEANDKVDWDSNWRSYKKSEKSAAGRRSTDPYDPPKRAPPPTRDPAVSPMKCLGWRGSTKRRVKAIVKHIACSRTRDPREGWLCMYWALAITPRVT